MLVLLGRLKGLTNAYQSSASPLRAMRKVQRNRGATWMRQLDILTESTGMTTLWRCTPTADALTDVRSSHAAVTWLKETGRWLLVDTNVFGWVRVTEIGGLGPTR